MSFSNVYALWTLKVTLAPWTLGWVSRLQSSAHHTPQQQVRLFHAEGKHCQSHFPTSTICTQSEPQAPSFLFPTQTHIWEAPGGPQHYRQPACGHTSHNLALGSVGSGVEAGAQSRSGRHRLRAKRSVVRGGGGRTELGAAETWRPQLGGVQRGQALCGLRGCGRSQGPRRAQHGECGAPYPPGSGARAGHLRALQPAAPRTPGAAANGRPRGKARPSPPGPPPSAAELGDHRSEIAWRG